MSEQHNISIPERLRPFVREILILDSSDLSFYADGCPGIIFQQTDSGLILNEDKKLSPVFLYGQTVEPIRMATTGSLKMIVVCLHPHAVHPIFRLSAKEITDDCLDLSLLPPAPGINLTEQLRNTAGPEQQFRLLFDYMQQVITRNASTVDTGMAYAVTHIWQAGRELSLKKLQQTLNLSERTFQRKFEQYIGIPPRLFSKISQFQAALAQLRGRKFFKLSDIAYDNGYADQSHFIRGFKKFTGLSPLAYIEKTLTPGVSGRMPLDKKQ
jgi:AraC-like DNA-binding protein